MKCSACGTESGGRFCPDCGAPLADAPCASCGAALPAGARFCTACGAAVHARPSRLPWLIAGAALAALVLVLIVPAIGDRPDRTAAADPAGPVGQAAPPLSAPGSGGAPPALSDDPRVNADQLFNRVMEERANGNMERARFFLPMAQQAYEMAEPLDSDGLFHLALLQSADGRFAAARATAERILATNEDHLLGLAVAGEAMAAGGDTAAARAYYRRYLDAYARESEKVYPEYVEHARVLPAYEQAARELLTGRE